MEEHKVNGGRRPMQQVLQEYFTNLAVPMPLGRKLRLLTRNLWIRVARRQSCCGHDGEPGC